MLQWWATFSKRPFVAHLLRAVERFNLRGGAQLAAAITYFSVLSLVPILMLAFAGLGLFLTVMQPGSLAQIEAYIKAQLPDDSTMSKSLYEVIANALNNWASVLGFGVLIIIWVSSGWVGNLKRAVRQLMREDADNPGKQAPMPLDVLANFGGLLGILVGVALTFASSLVATTLGDTVGSWLGVGQSLGWTLLIRLVGFLVALAIGAVGFRLLFAWFSPTYVPSHLAWVGAGLGSASLLVLQAFAGLLWRSFSNNLGAAVFGSTIVLMIFLNLFATLILYIAAWLATSVAPVPEPVAIPAIEPPGPSMPIGSRPGELYVSSDVAKRTLGIGLGTGYVIGAATGLGIGAVLTSLLSGLFGRRT
ncbi:MAG: YihY/virulence factor BrkB family protein [Actinobacteria bacterium]|nr:YihY/virulence factor BrkB family protein [Actinomycetota bacterium]